MSIITPKFSMQQGIQYFTLRKYRSMLEIKNTALEFLPLTGIFTLIFETLLYYFWIRKPFFCIKRS